MDLSEGKAGLLAEIIKTEINHNTEADNPPQFSWRVKPSSLGEECVAKEWYGFRWALAEQKPAHVIRMFARGAKEELNFVVLLRRAGWEVREYSQRLCYRPGDESYAALDWADDIAPDLIDVSIVQHHIDVALNRHPRIVRQWHVKRFGGHYSGRLDAIVRHPNHTGNEWILAECKTFKSRLFSTLVNKNDLSVSNPKYHSQMVQYMDFFGLQCGLFIGVNKDDDDIHFEMVEANPGLALKLMGTAHTIATSLARPARVAESSAYHKCKVCDFVAICHRGAPVNINCRSCQHCVADTETGDFRCEKWKAIIPNEKAIIEACPSHLPIV